MVRLGQTKAANPFACGQLGQVFLLLRFGAERIDRHHHQRRLHAHHGTVTGVDAFHFAGNQAITHIVQAAATVLLGDGRTEQADFTHLAKDRRVGLLMTERLQYTRSQLVLGELISAVTHHALFFSELLIQQQRVDPVEACFTGHERNPRNRGAVSCAIDPRLDPGARQTRIAHA